jgi:retrotransposon gag protein
MDQFQQLQQIVHTHVADIQALRAEVTSLRAQLDSRPPRRPKPQLPDPDKFTGTPLTWDTWLPLIKAKLRIDGDAIGGPEARFFYLYGRLDGKVQALVTPQLEHAETTQLYDTNDLFAPLLRLYDDPNKVENAEDRLHSIQQGEDTLVVYLAKFERLLYKANANTWPDKTKIALLRKGLASTMRTRLKAQLSLPTTYSGFVAVLQKLAGSAVASGPASGSSDRMDIGILGPVRNPLPVSALLDIDSD